MRAAELKVRSAWSRVAVADAARYPSFSLSGSLGLSSLTLGSLTDSASLVRSLLASVSAPLFDGGAAKAQVRAQEAALDQARASYQDAVLTALQDVEDALVAIQGDRERLARLQAAATAAANAELLARQRYQSGLIDFATVLGTQRSLAVGPGQRGQHPGQPECRPRAPVQGAGRWLDARQRIRRRPSPPRKRRSARRPPPRRTDTHCHAMNKKTATPADLQALLGEDHPPRWWQRSSLWIGLAALLIAGRRSLLLAGAEAPARPRPPT